MEENKKRKATTIRLSQEDIEAILVIRQHTMAGSDNKAILHAIHHVAKYYKLVRKPNKREP